MADIKIDKTKFELFLIKVQSFTENIDDNILSSDMINEKKDILEYINIKNEKRNLMEERKLYYDFYIANKTKDPISSSKMYRKYIETNEKLNKLREENKWIV